MVNKKWVKILKAARALLEEDKAAYVNSAIRRSDFGIFNIFYSSAKISLEAELDVRLDGHVQEKFWMWAEHPTISLQIAKNNQWKEYRLAWIDNMIEEFYCGKSSEFSGNTVEITGTTYKFFGGNSGETPNFKSSNSIVFIDDGIR